MKTVVKEYIKNGGLKTTRLFTKNRKMLNDHNVLVLVDLSGSMFYARGGGSEKIKRARESIIVLARTLENMNVKFSIRGYTATWGEDEIVDVAAMTRHVDHLV